MDLPAPFGKYELLERIATGGMAEVFLARSFGVAGFEKRLVIKRIRPELARDPRFVQLFIQEAKISVHLNHPNVVQVYDLGKVGDFYYMAMEHLHGRDLTRLVKTLRADDLRLPVPTSCAIVAELLRGLHYAHTRSDADGRPLGLVHRDVSPHNVVVTFDGAAKLVDFGVARVMNTVASETEGVRHGPGGGKYAYMSPEQAAGAELDHRTDVFSAGIVLWELIVGRRLFQDPDPDEKLRRVTGAVIPDPRESGAAIDDELWRILRRAMARDRDDRYASAALFEEDLRAWLFQRGEPAGAAEVATWMRRAFPEAQDPSRTTVDLRRLVADLERLDAHDHSHSGHSTAPTPSEPMPRLPVAEGERKPVTALVIDVDGLTDLSLRLDPADLFRRQYRLLRWLKKTLERYGGRVLRAVDDQIVAVFGVPLAREDDTVRALEAAAALTRGVGDQRARGLPIRLAIGAHAGEVTASHVAHRARYVARGDTTRLARRLSAAADHGQVVCSEAIVTAARGEFRFSQGPGIANRGGATPTRSFLLEQRRRGLRAGSTGTWLRRGGELDMLRQALVALAEGQGGAIAVTGPMGAGKSRFVREIRDLAARRGLPFYAARCGPIGADPPMEPFRDLVRQIAGVGEEGGAAELGRLAQLGLAREEVDALIAFLGLGERSAGAEATWHALERALDGVSREGPAVLALEDADRLGGPDLEGWRQLVDATRERPLLWLLTHKEPVGARVSAVARVMRLGPFDAAATRRLVVDLLDVDDVDPAILALLQRTCEGNPLYVEEMVRYLARTERLLVVDGRAALAGEVDRPTLPGSLSALLAARIDALDPAARGVLQLAATIGAEFGADLLAAAAGVEDVDRILAGLHAHGLVMRGEGDRWAFSSELVRESVLHRTLGVQRRDQHRLVAGAIEALYPGAPAWAAPLAHHLAEGGRYLEAAKVGFHAGEALERDHFLERALLSYQRALHWISQAPEDPATWDARTQGEATLHYRIGALHVLLGEGLVGERALQLALDIASDAGLPWIEARAHVELGRSYLERGKRALAAAHLRQADALLAVEPDDAVSVACLETRAALAFEEGASDRALELWRAALDRAADDPGATARCLLGLANRHLRRGATDAARPLLDRALAAAREARDRILEGRVLNNIGLLSSLDGDPDAAIGWFRQALEVRQGIGYTRGVCINHHNIGDAHFAKGDLARAWVAFERSRELALASRFERGVALNDVYLGYIEASRGDEASGLKRILDARAAAARLGDPEVSATGAWLAGRWLADHGRRDEALGLLRDGLTEAERYGLDHAAAAIRGVLAATG